MSTNATHVLQQFQDEFGALTDAVEVALTRWAETDDALAEVRSVASVAAVLCGDNHDRRDAVLLALLRRAADVGRDAELAARLVIDRMTPAVAAMTSRIGRLPSVTERPGDIAVMVLGHLWERVRCFPLHRTRHVAANLVRDTHTATLRALGVHSRQQRDWRTGETFLHLVPLLDETEHKASAAGDVHCVRNSSEELLELLAWALEQRWLDDLDARVLTARFFGPMGRDGVATDAQIGQVCSVSKATAHRARVRAQASLAAAAAAYPAAEHRTAS